MADTSSGSDLDAVRACVERTLDAPGVRVRYRYDLELPGTTDEDRRRAHGLRGLVRRSLGNLFSPMLHSTLEGFAELAVPILKDLVLAKNFNTLPATLPQYNATMQQ